MPSNEITSTVRTPRAGLWLFIAFAALFTLSTHGHVTGMGYADESYLTAKQLVEYHDSAVYGSGRAGTLKAYVRNGLTEPLLHVPFYLVARLLPAGHVFTEEWVMALFNPLASAGIVFFTYRFALALYASQRMSVLLAALCGLGTMIWPYAIIGMEPLQTLLALIVAYLGFRFRRGGSGVDLALAGLTLALLYQSKRGSPFLAAPLLLYLLFAAWERFRTDRRAAAGGMAAVSLLLAAGIVSSLWFAALKDTGLVEGVPGPHLDPFAQMARVSKDGIFVLGGLYGFLFSAGKSYFLYNPPTLLGLYAFPAFWRRHRIEALLFTALLLIPYGFYSLLYWWGEETWGPRFLHSTVPFAILFLGAIGWETLRGIRWRAGLALTLAIGIAVQILGVLFWYGRQMAILMQAGLNTLQNMQYDPQLSHIWVNLLLAWSALSRRLFGGQVYLDYTPRYWFAPPPGYEQIAAARHIDLAPHDALSVWFAYTLASPAVSTTDKILTAVLVVGLLAMLAIAVRQGARVFSPIPSSRPRGTPEELPLPRGGAVDA